MTPIRDAAIAILASVHAAGFSEDDIRASLAAHPHGAVARTLAPIEARIVELMRRQREACAKAFVANDGESAEAVVDAILTAEVE